MFELAYSEWQQKYQKFELRNDPFIDGEFVPAHSDKTHKMFDPVNNQLIATVALCDKNDVDHAVQSAKRIYSSHKWSGMSSTERKEVLDALVELIVENKEELALLETIDMGKQAIDSLHLDSIGASAILRWYAEGGQENFKKLALPQTLDSKIESGPSTGVVGIIIPCNFPLHQILCKIFPLLMAGNSVVIKPPLQSPHAMLRVAELAKLAGLPSGLLNVLPGYTYKTGRALAFNGDIDRLLFYFPWGANVYSFSLLKPLRLIRQVLSSIFRFNP